MVVIRFLLCAFLRRGKAFNLLLVFANDFADDGEKVVVLSIVVVIIIAGGKNVNEIFVYVIRAFINASKCVRFVTIFSP